MVLLFSFVVAYNVFFDLENVRSVSSQKEEEFSFLNYIEMLESTLDDGINSSTDCVWHYSDFYTRLLKVRSSDIDMELDGSTYADLMERSFKIRLSIREKLKELEERSDITTDCLKYTRNMIRALRYAEDFIANKVAADPDYTRPEEYITLEGKGPHFQVNPGFSDFKNWRNLKSGDIILSRGSAFTSAAIARFGEVDAQFSHISLAYTDPNGDLHTVESHIEIGNVVAPFINHINQKNSRTVVFRHADSKLAHKAGRIMYELVKKHSDSGENIQYDFSMNHKNDDRIFCSEVPHIGYLRASNGKMDIPTYKMKFERTLLPFLEMIGIGVDENTIDDFESFAPGDMEFDTRFELVAEWRNFDKLEDSRIKDAILTKMFFWIENFHYMFKKDLGTTVKSAMGWLLRRIPPWKKKYKTQFPLNMTTRQLGSFMLLDRVGEKLHQRILNEQKKRKSHMTFIEMFEVLEEYRIEDYKKYKALKHYRRQDPGYQMDNPKPKAPDFHLIFNSNYKYLDRVKTSSDLIFF